MLRYAYPITCTSFSKDPSTGDVSEIRVTYDADFAGKKPPKGVLNWVGQPSPGATPPRFEARLYDSLFASASLSDDWLEELNPNSLTVIKGCYATPRLASAKPGDRFQLERLGYFCVDPDSSAEHGTSLVLNRTVTLRDSYGGPSSS
jgi:glutaminyl-tRNA synthetase